MNVGDYVRIKNKAGWCCIGKIVNINEFREPDMKYCIDIQGEDYIFVPEDMIAKSSPNIIDLIEVGDYVNGYEVTSKDQFLGFGNHDWYMINDEIKSIVTKEQFSQMKYKVGE